MKKLLFWLFDRAWKLAVYTPKDGSPKVKLFLYFFKKPLYELEIDLKKMEGSNANGAIKIIKIV